MKMSFCKNSLLHASRIIRANLSVARIIYHKQTRIFTQSQRTLSLTATRYDLKEFFDEEDNWKATKIRVGRPWLKEELRLKSNQDLHKLWYILLKERNMVMTMLQAYADNEKTPPAPERIEKVEESMENLLDVVAERDNAVNLLEEGETKEPGKRWVVNDLGRGVWRKNTEHVEPIHANPGYLRDTQTPQQTEWAIPYKRAYREEIAKRKRQEEEEEKAFQRILKKKLPDEQYYPDGKEES